MARLYNAIRDEAVLHTGPDVISTSPPNTPRTDVKSPAPRDELRLGTAPPYTEQLTQEIYAYGRHDSHFVRLFARLAEVDTKHKQALAAEIKILNARAAARSQAVKSANDGNLREKHVLYLPPEVRKLYEEEAQRNGAASDAVRKAIQRVSATGNLPALRATLLDFVNSGKLRLDLAADLAKQLAKVDLKLGNDKESFELSFAALPYVGHQLEPQDDVLVFASIIAARRGKTFPFQSAYLSEKINRATRFGLSTQGGKYIARGQSVKEVLFMSYIFIADGAGGSRDMEIAPFCAEQALKMHPNNPVALIEFGRTHGVSSRSMVRVRDRLPTGPLRDELAEIISPGGTLGHG